MKELIHIRKEEAKPLKKNLQEIESVVNQKLEEALLVHHYTNASIYREVLAFLTDKETQLKIK